MSRAKTLDQLAADAAAATEALTDARSRVEAAVELAAKQRAAALIAYDKARLDRHDESTLNEAVTDATAALHAAIDADPVSTAYIALQAARIRRSLQNDEAGQDAARLGLDRPLPTVRPAPTLTNELAVLRYIEQRAHDLAADEADARDAARTAAGEAAAG